MALTKVQYVGMSDVRVMSKDDLAGAGVFVDRDMHWDQRNGWTQVVEDPNDDLLMIFKKEGTFTVSSVEEDETKNRTIVKHDQEALDDMTGHVVSIDDQALVAEQAQKKAAKKA
jgi:hypothetical protein